MASPYAEFSQYLGALALSQPRVLAMFALLPFFNRQLLPGILRYGISFGLSLMLIPVLLPRYVELQPVGLDLLLLITKEVFIGLALGFMVALPFWIFEAVGFVIDNQRGASIGATINPATGNDSSPLGILFNQAFMVFFLISGGFGLMLSLLYNSFRIWDVFAWFPVLEKEGIPFFLGQLSMFARTSLLLAAPVIVAMFLAELGLGLISRFAPQLQVFFLAMPVKSALALLVLVLYMSTLFEYAAGTIDGLTAVVPALSEQWGGR